MSLRKEVKELVRAAEEQGWRAKEGAKHWKLYSPDGRHIEVIARTPGSREGLMQSISRMRRYGFRWKGR